MHKGNGEAAQRWKKNKSIADGGERYWKTKRSVLNLRKEFHIYEAGSGIPKLAV